PCCASTFFVHGRINAAAALPRLLVVRLFGERIDKFAEARGEKHDVSILVVIIFVLDEHYLSEGAGLHAIQEIITSLVVRERNISARKHGCPKHQRGIRALKARTIANVHGQEVVNTVGFSIFYKKSRTRSSAVVPEVMFLEIFRQVNAQASL